jgi:hypothetical protein
MSDTPELTVLSLGKKDRADKQEMLRREAAVRDLINEGYTVLEAGRALGLTRHQAEHLAQTRGIKCLQGALNEAKSDAGVKGNQTRWGGA